MSEADVDEMRRKFEDLWDKLSAADFKRLHQKFVDCLLSLETGFKKKFPEEFEKWEREFYQQEKP
jgi:hypothetical protein